MSRIPFQAEVRSLPGLVSIDLAGDIDGFAEAGLAEAYSSAEAQQPGGILLNFARVGYINSTGIALIVGLLARARAARRRLLACGLSDHYVEIFNITRLADFMAVFPSERDALRDIPEIA
jgi:anti-sigma B factor antagonist